MGKLLGFVLLLAVVAFGLSFALLNADAVAIDYYLGEVSLPLSLALTLAFVLGAICGVIAMLGAVFKQRRELAKRGRRLEQCERELAELRTLPLKDAA